jgi:hypothetical protein
MRRLRRQAILIGVSPPLANSAASRRLLIDPVPRGQGARHSQRRVAKNITLMPSSASRAKARSPHLNTEGLRKIWSGSMIKSVAEPANCAAGYSPNAL